MEAQKDWKMKKIRPIGIVTIGAFFCLFAFFTVAHPMYIYDTDDWTYISSHRHALPMTHAWNPTKILPETLMPLAAEIGVRFIMPFSGDYIGAMAYAFAFFVAMFIVLYILAFGRVLKEKFSLDDKVISIMLVIFLLWHFLPFNVNGGGGANSYLFYSSNVTCYFNYVIPALLNAIMVMYLMTHHQIEWKNEKRDLRNGFLILAIYLCINSNLFHSAVLMSYIGMRLIVSLAGKIYAKEYKDMQAFLTGYILSNFGDLLVSVVWVLSAVMEAKGGRAHMGYGQFLLKESFNLFVNSIVEMNVFFRFGGTVVIILGLVAFMAARLNGTQGDDECIYCRWLYKNVICLTLAALYLILLCARVSPHYITKADVMIVWMFYLILLVMGSLAYLVKKVRLVCWILPLALYVLIFETIIDEGTYKDTYAIAYSADTIKALDENLIKQVVKAEEAGLDEVEVLVPYLRDESWPIAISYGGDRISVSLFRHGITHKQMKIHLVMDQSLNEEFHLP